MPTGSWRTDNPRLRPVLVVEKIDDDDRIAMPARDRSGRPVIVFVEYTDVGVVKAEAALGMGITFLSKNLGRRCLGDGITTPIG